jgi:hypothetical protein
MFENFNCLKVVLGNGKYRKLYWEVGKEKLDSRDMRLNEKVIRMEQKNKRTKISYKIFWKIQKKKLQ